MSFPTVRLGSVAVVERKGIDPSTIPAATKYVGLEHILSDGTLV